MRREANIYREKRRGGMLLSREGGERAELIQDTRNREIKGVWERQIDTIRE